MSVNLRHVGNLKNQSPASAVRRGSAYARANLAAVETLSRLRTPPSRTKPARLSQATLPLCCFHTYCLNIIRSSPPGVVVPLLGSEILPNRGTSFIRNTPPLGPYSRTKPRVLWWSLGGGAVSYERGTHPPGRRRTWRASVKLEGWGHFHDGTKSTGPELRGQ